MQARSQEFSSIGRGGVETYHILATTQAERRRCRGRGSHNPRTTRPICENLKITLVIAEGGGVIPGVRTPAPPWPATPLVDWGKSVHPILKDSVIVKLRLAQIWVNLQKMVTDE